MSFISTRAGAFASAAAILTIAYGAHAAGAYAQDQAEAETLELASHSSGETDAAAQPDAQPPVRFVASPVVQDVPEPKTPEPETAAVAATPASSAGSLRELVAQINFNAEMSRDVKCLAQAVYFESRGEPLSGQLAVARVVINRASSEIFPDDYCSVVTQRAQFSFVRGGTIPEPNRSSQAWQRAKAIARIAHRELWESEVGDALYFHATHVRPRWARTMQTRAQIDSHIFYR